MKKFFMIIAAVFALTGLAACSATERGAAYGGAAGAIVGGVTTGTVQGAAIGGAIGAAGGALLGKVAGYPDECYYERANGTYYRAACPAGY